MAAPALHGFACGWCALTAIETALDGRWVIAGIYTAIALVKGLAARWSAPRSAGDGSRPPPPLRLVPTLRGRSKP